jgi:hypothetical protein
MKPLVLAVVAMLAPACAVHRDQPTSGEASASLAGPQDREKQDLQDLWMQIREWRVEMRWGTEPPRELIRQYRYQSVRQLRVCPANPQPESNTCRDICSIAAAICDNAEGICRIAAQIKGDWAQEKCANAKASCKEGTQRCCDCVVAE